MVSRLWQQLAALIKASDVRISEHGYDAVADDGLTDGAGIQVIDANTDGVPDKPAANWATAIAVTSLIGSSLKKGASLFRGRAGRSTRPTRTKRFLLRRGRGSQIAHWRCTISRES